MPKPVTVFYKKERIILYSIIAKNYNLKEGDQIKSEELLWEISDSNAAFRGIIANLTFNENQN